MGGCICKDDRLHLSEEEPLIEKDTPQTSKRPKCCRLIVVEPYVILFAASDWPIWTIFNQYFYRKVGRSMGVDVDNLTSSVNSSFGQCGTDLNDTNYILREQVQAATAQWIFYFSVAAFFPSMFAYVYYGSLSDKIGRKFAFILPPIGSILRSGLMMCVIYFDLPIWVFFFNMVDSFFGGFELATIACYTYIVDTTDQKYLALRNTILNTLLTISGGVVSLGLGYWIRNSGYFWPSTFVVVGKLLCLIYAIFFIPETVGDKRKTNIEHFHIRHILRPFKIFTHDNGTGRRWKINMICSAFIAGSLFASFSVLNLVQMNAPLCWDSVLIGYYSAVDLSVKTVGGAVGMSFKACLAEEWLAVISSVSNALVMAFLPFVTSTVMMFITPALGCFNYVFFPMTRTILSSYVGADEQGALFAAMTITSSFCDTFGDMASNKIFAETIFFLQGRVVFIISSGLTLVSIVILLVFIAKTKADRQRRLESENAPLTHGDGLVESKRRRRRQLVTEETSLID